MKRAALLLAFFAAGLRGQEAGAGFDVRATVSAEAIDSPVLSERSPNASPVDGGVRAVLYPTLKLNEHWIISGAFQLISRPYFREDFYAAGHGIRGRILQANIGYSRVGRQGSILLRAGQMSTAFGSFLLRYDDMDNPLAGMPLGYGYYYQPVSTLGLAAAQADLTWRKWDARLQIANSSPANPRSIFDKDQYRNEAAGIGYTVRQGFRIGASAYRGPYLYAGSPYIRPGDSHISGLPATAAGIDAQWAAGHSNIYGEWQKFTMPYDSRPAFRQSTGYFEIRRTLAPRWYVAARAGYLSNSFHSGKQLYEGAVGFRPDTRQVLKIGYETLRTSGPGEIDNALILQLVTAFHPVSLPFPAVHARAN